MSEEAAIYRLDAAEERGRANTLEDLYRRASVEANHLRVRVRELEDAVMLHRDRWDVDNRDELLYTVLDEPWT